VLAAAGGMLLYLALRGSPQASPPQPPSPPPPTTPAPPPSAHPLLVGVDDDSLKWSSRPLAVVARQQSVGAEAVRVWVPWHGEAAPGATRRAELARDEQAARRTKVVLAVFGFAGDTPTADAAQERFCGYARAALARVPDAVAVVVWNETNSRTYWRGTPAEYERLLARCYDALHALRPDVVVLDSTASTPAPARFLSAVATAYRAAGRTAPLVDAFGHNPYPRSSDEAPAATHPPGFLGEGDYPRLVTALENGFAGTAQEQQLDVWYLEDGYQSDTPQQLLDGYSGSENAATVAADVQAERLRQAIALAACQPGVRAFLNFELVDETRLAGWQSGLYWRGPVAKPAAAAFAGAARAASKGTIDCASAGGSAAARP
jgi:hypothetical protein